jgi:hypothetical protein
MHVHAPTLFSFCLLLFARTAAAKAKPKNAILLSEVESLTLRADRQTTHRRVSAIPQLKCISSAKLCALHKIDTLRCTNQGSGYDAQDIQWSCAAELPPELKLGSTDVICEGYDGPDDPYVLKGSCGVEYRLALTERGEQRFPELAGSGGFWGGIGNKKGSGPGEQGTDWGAWAFAVLFIGVAAWIMYSAFYAANENRRRPAVRRPRAGRGGGGGFWPGGGGGGDGGGWDDPPPPYPGTKPYQSQNEGWRPGFWSGLAGGAAAGYMAGNRGNNREDRRHDYTRGWGSGSTSGSGSGWGGGSSSRGSGSTSTSRYESTGFGSTSRR